MADSILQTQQRNAGKFFENERVDILVPKPHISPAMPVAPEKLYTTPINSDAFGSTIEYELPFGYLGDCYLSVNLGALSSGNYCSYPGLCVIDEVELRSGSNILQSFRYAPVMRAICSKLDHKATEMFKIVAGSTGFASGLVVCPLPLFWTDLATGYSENQPPLNTHLSSTKLRLRIKMRTAAQIAASGATVGSPTIATKLYYLNSVTSDDLRQSHIAEKDGYLYPTYDWQTIPQSVAVPENTSTTLDASSFHGSLAELYVSHTLVSGVDTTHAYFVDEGDLDILKVYIDGREYWSCEQKNSIKYNNLALAACRGLTAVFGDPAVIPFSIGYDPSGYTGSLCMDSVNKLSVVVSHSAGADCYIDISTRVNCFYKLSGGSFVRVN